MGVILITLMYQSFLCFIILHVVFFLLHTLRNKKHEKQRIYTFAVDCWDYDLWNLINTNGTDQSIAEGQAKFIIKAFIAILLLLLVMLLYFLMVHIMLEFWLRWEIR